MPALIRENRNFRLLFSASAISNLGDGISAVAFPWLATLFTRDPFLIAGVAAAARLPWFLFSLPAGVITDRADRRRLMLRADIFRVALTCGILMLIFGAPPLPLHAADAALPFVLALAAIAFLLGSAEVLRDNAAQTILPAIVDKADLERANGQMWSVEQVMGAFVGPPLAGVLIALAVPLPFGVDALSFALAAAAVWMIAIPARPLRVGGGPGLWSEFRAGVAWIWQHRLILRLAVILGLLNAAAMASLSLLVLFSQDILGLGAFGHGLLLTAGAVGGVLGGLLAPRIVARLGGNLTTRIALGLFAASYLAIGVTASPLVAGAALFVEAFGAMLWNVYTVSFRQRLIPDEILGRVNSIYRFFAWGMMPVGALAGGAAVALLEPSLGREAALRVPYLGAAAAVGLLALAAIVLLRFPPNRAAE